MELMLIVPFIVSAISLAMALVAVCHCIKKKPATTEVWNVQKSQTATVLDYQQHFHEREYCYTGMREYLWSPSRESRTMKWLPEYSEVVYPYPPLKLNRMPVETHTTKAVSSQTPLNHNPHSSAVDTLQV